MRQDANDRIPPTVLVSKPDSHQIDDLGKVFQDVELSGGTGLPIIVTSDTVQSEFVAFQIGFQWNRRQPVDEQEDCTSGTPIKPKNRSATSFAICGAQPNIISPIPSVGTASPMSGEVSVSHPTCGLDSSELPVYARLLPQSTVFNTHRWPTAEPHVGQATEDSCLGVSSFCFIYIKCASGRV